MHYGHKLETGLLVVADSTAALERARHAEKAGYDLVLFQEGSGESDGPDLWTMLTWTAGMTSQVQISASLTDERLQLPAVLARSAISLDLLSGGRLNLVLGQGDNQADALFSIIEIVREMMDVRERTPLTRRGGFFPLEGAQRGPMPAHDIPIWVAAATPEMLRLAGQRADVWLAPYETMRPVDIDVANQFIDDAAADAGRDPAEIRRAILTSSLNVDELLPLVVDQGISTFLFNSESPEMIDRFADEVMPALWTDVEQAIPGAPRIHHLPRADVRAQRQAGIDYDAIPASLRGRVIEPGDVRYPSVRSTYIRGGSPGIVLQPEHTDQVVEALSFARAHPDLPLSIRSRGHGISGRSTNHGGIVIDLSRMNAIEVLDEATRRVRLEPGARWMDVAAALQPYGWGLSSGDYGGVGVGGLATAGGVGWLSRKHGLTIDHLLAVEMVLADGSVVRASQEENPDLFWAVRGAGANFGIVTSFEFEVYEVGNIGFGQFVIDATDTAEFLQTWGATVEAAPRELTSFLILGPPRLGQPMVAQVLTAVASDDPNRIVENLQPIAGIGSTYNQQVFITPYADLMANAQGSHHDAVGEPTARSGLIEHITPEFAAAANELIRSRAIYFFQIRSVGGAVADVSPDATAYANRAANFSVTAFGANAERVNAVWDKLAHHFDGLYISFETDQRPERLEDAFPGETLRRLRALKSHYDPQNIFRDNFNVAENAVAR